jgi:uroporphyrinogen-III decarboxylase
MNGMSTQERLQALLHFQSFDRLPIVEWAVWWHETLNRWYQEGLPGQLRDRYEIQRHLGMDVWRQFWFHARTASCPKPAYHGAGLISNMDEYQSLKKYLYPKIDVENTIGAVRQEHERGDCGLWFTIDGPFWYPRTLLGIERHLFAFYDQPELMHQINQDITEWHLDLIKEICRVSQPDFCTLAEDMSYNHGPMLGKEQFEAFLKPYYEQLVPLLQENNIVIIVDSDGDVAEPAPWFEQAGIQGILPLERKAGVDIAQLRADHPEMRFIGHFDKMKLNQGESRMREEFERLLPTARKGGFAISVDHQTPPGVSYDQYQSYLQLFREYAIKAAE